MSELKLWNSNADVAIQDTKDVEAIARVAKQLKPVDQRQLVTAFNAGNYQMLSTYVWSKTIAALKSQLTKMGSAFIGEMLDRPDINDQTNLQQAIPDFEAIQLAENLGLINAKSAFRLKHAMDLLAYFNNPDLEELDDNDFSKIDAMQVLLACVQGVLGQDKIELRIDFKKFRDSLEDGLLTHESQNVATLMESPFFFKRATIRILLSIIKSKSGAQLENALANALLIVPSIWSDLKQPERWQIGRCYAELFNEGKSTAVSGLKKVLLKVKGFDFVPEDLRSTSFIKAANEVIKAHEGTNNYYFEPAPTKVLKDMGSTIPTPAFPICMSAVLSIKLGNLWGYSWDAQYSADGILENVKKDRWIYYFEECLPTDSRILYKLTQDKPRNRWIELIKQTEEMSEVAEALKNPSIKNLALASLSGSSVRIQKFVQAVQSENGKPQE